MIRQYSLVQLDRTQVSDLECSKYPSFFHDGSEVVFMGEIPNRPGEGVFCSKNHIYIGYPIRLFVEVS